MLQGDNQKTLGKPLFDRAASRGFAVTLQQPVPAHSKQRFLRQFRL